MWTIAGKTCHSHILLGTAQYPSLEILDKAIQASKTEIITVSLKKENPYEHKKNAFWESLKQFKGNILPNTAGCKSAHEAIELAQMSREIFNTHWIKLEVIGDDYLLQPHPFELVKAARTLIDLGFEVFPYCTDDLVLCQTLFDMGCQVLMPWGSPIGSGKGLNNPFQLSVLRSRLPNATLIVDAGIGSPLHAMHAMLLGFDGILMNSAISKARDPVKMATAFSLAVESGRLAYQAGVMPEVDFAVPSTPLPETLFWSKV